MEAVRIHHLSAVALDLLQAMLLFVYTFSGRPPNWQHLKINVKEEKPRPFYS